MDNYYEYIDNYFSQRLSTEELRQFEQRIIEDKSFADEVAFYLSSKQALKDQVAADKKEWFKQLFEQSSSTGADEGGARVRKIVWYRVAAAAAIFVCVVLAGYLFFLRPVSPQTLADTYINKELTQLPVKMGKLDSIQNGLRLYNEAKYDSAALQFETIIQKDTGNFSVKKYLGIVYLRSGNYDKALQYFQALENYSLFSNPAIFYQALTLMKRNQPGDKQKAKQLLQQVVGKNLERKETAEQWLRKW